MTKPKLALCLFFACLISSHIFSQVDSTTPPTIGAPGPNATIECTTTPFFTPPTASGGCGGVTVNQLNDVTAVNGCTKAITRTWDAVDACGNHSATISQTSTIVDNVAPTIGNAGLAATINCTATPIFTPPTAGDACSGATVNNLGNLTSGNSCLRTITRRWDATDACGNHSATVSQTITIIDNVAPTIGSVGAAATINCTATPTFTPPTASDACNGATINTLGNVSAGTSCLRTITRRWDAVDACGNHSATVSQTITLVDIAPPTIGAPGANATIQYPATPSFTAPTAADLCGVATVNLINSVIAAGPCANCYTATKTWDAVDACGNHSATVSQTITVINTPTSPTIGAPGANATIECTATPFFTAPTASGSCGGVTVNQLSDVTAAGSCANNYSRTRTWDAVDSCGNHSATVSQTITVIDNTPPTIGAPGPTITTGCPPTLFFSPPPIAFDLCGGVTVNQLNDVTIPGTCANSYMVIRSWDAVDACGNHSSTVSQTLFVVDNTPPTIGAAGANATVQYPATPSFTPPTAADLCGPVTVQLLADVTAAGTCANCYTATRTWDAVDACGNHSATVAQIITVIESTPPDTTCLNGSSLFQEIYAGGRNDLAYSIAPAADGGHVIVGATNSFGNGGVDGFIMKINKKGSVVWSKAVGGSSDDVLYTIRKTTDAGFIICGQSKSYGNPAGDAWLIKLDSSGNIQWSKKFGDGNVYGDAALDVTQLSDGGYAFVGPHKWSGGVVDGFVVRTDPQGNVIWSRSYGNSNSDYPNCILEDGNFLLVAGIYYGASFYDGYVMKLDKSNGAVQWIRGYDAENRSTWMNKITKINTGYQVLSGVTDNFVDQNQQECIWNINTDGSLQSVRKPVIPGTWTITYGWYPLADGGFIGANAENNSGSDGLVFRVNANGSLHFSKQYPVAGRQAIWNITSTLEGGYALLGYSTNAPTIADSNNIYVMKIDSLGGSCSGVNTNAVSVVSPSFSLPTPDVALIGNLAINSPMITVGVIEFIPVTNTVCETCVPASTLTITATGSALTLGCNPSAAAIDAALGTASATGGCSTATVNASTGIVQISGCFHSQTRTFTATDTCGNTATTSRTATWIEDVTPPSVIATGIGLNLGCNPSPAAINAALGSASATDSCTIPSLSISDSPVQINGCTRSQTRTFTATDSCGNTRAVSRTATWKEDFTPPTIGAAGANATIHCTATPSFTPPTASDACNPVTVNQLGDVTALNGCAQTITRSWDAVDACGNQSAIVSQTITIIDLMPPTIGAAGPNATINCTTTPVFMPPTASDDCNAAVVNQLSDVTAVNGCTQSITRSWDAVDACGNHSAVVSQTITIIDNLPPTITCGADKTIDCGTTVQFDQPTATDNCGGTPIIEVVSTSADGRTRTWIATDACGNTATCSQTITVATCTAHIFPTATTCCHYVAGTAPQLQKVCYSKQGNSISKVVPGVFFYYSFVTAPSAGPFVITVEQFNNNADFQLFSIQNVIQLRLTDLSCGTGSIAFSGGITGTNNSQATLNVTSYTPGATYVVSIKYDAKSITGSTFAGSPTATYTFRSKVNGVIAPGSSGTLNAQSGCQDDTPNPPNNCQLTTVSATTREQSNATITAYPNPFTDIVNFQISASVSGKVTLELYNLQGQKLGVAFEGWMMVGEVRTVQYKSRTASGGLIYQLSIGDKRMAGKVFRLK